MAVALLVACVVALVTAAVLALAAGARRTAAAPAAFTAAAGGDHDAYVEQPDGAPRTAEVAALAWCRVGDGDHVHLRRAGRS